MYSTGTDSYSALLGRKPIESHRNKGPLSIQPLPSYIREILLTPHNTRIYKWTRSGSDQTWLVPAQPRQSESKVKVYSHVLVESVKGCPKMVGLHTILLVAAFQEHLSSPHYLSNIIWLCKMYFQEIIPFIWYWSRALVIFAKLLLIWDEFAQDWQMLNSNFVPLISWG